MLIVSHRETYVAPHRHLEKSETLTVLEGVADVILFREDGTPETVLKMGPPASGLPFFYRMPPRVYHSMAIESELLVFLESTSGPFRAENCDNAPWAPGPDETALGRAYTSLVLQAARGS
jgi:cupin fold WbuC family metalloprotein